MSRPLPEGSPVLLGQPGEVLLTAAADWALAAKDPFGIFPPFAFAVED